MILVFSGAAAEPKLVFAKDRSGVFFDAALRFGGYKQSGWGREMGPEALELYTETKAVCVQL